jgi:hypothetical protein
MLNGGLVTWGSRKPDYTIGSTTKVEYISTHVATNEITWMNRLLEDLGYGQVALIELWSDNQAMIRLM